MRYVETATDARRPETQTVAKLAVFTAHLGAMTETFVRRHVQDLWPGDTVVVTRQATHHTGGLWEAGCPALQLDSLATRWPSRLARRAGRPWSALRDEAVANFLRRHRVEVVLGEYLDVFVDFIPVLERLGIPYVAQGHGIDLSAALRRPGAAESYRAYASARAVLTRCEAHRDRLISLGLSADKVHVNPGGVDIPPPRAERPPQSAKRLLAVGRMTAKKGPIYLLEAFRRATARDPALTLDYVGGGELAVAAHQFVAACGLDDRVTLHGAAPEETKLRLLDECGVFVQHSVTDPATGDEEGLPASIQEAMAHGLAVVSTRHAGIVDAVEHGVTGFLGAEGDVEEMSRLIASASDHARARVLGARGAAKARTMYSWAAERRRLLGHLGLPTTVESCGAADRLSA